MDLNKLGTTLDGWLNAVARFSPDQLALKFHPDKWTLGQLLVHVIDSSLFFLQNCETCMNSSQHKEEPVSDAASEIFLMNALPDREIKGPPVNDAIPQPSNLALLVRELEKLKLLAAAVKLTLKPGLVSGKTRHPGLGYLDAWQWYAFTDIHLRHHSRQLQQFEVRLSSRQQKRP